MAAMAAIRLTLDAGAFLWRRGCQPTHDAWKPREVIS